MTESSSPLQLPERPSLEQLKKQAKELHGSVEFPTLAATQHALARRAWRGRSFRETRNCVHWYASAADPTTLWTPSLERSQRSSDSWCWPLGDTGETGCTRA
jgi:hypothetical protein